jgi:hypothetical protein
MFACRRVSVGFSLICLALSIAGCAVSGLDSIQIAPATQALAVGQTAQFTATGTYGNGNHPRTQVITTGLTWTSSAPGVATVDPTGMATAVGAGTTTITASATAFNGPVTSTATLTVTGSGPATNQGLTSITILPGTEPVSVPGQTVQFIAIGTYASAPTTRDLTSMVSWSSSVVSVATIDASGLATYLGGITTTIVASYAPTPNGPVVTATATLSSSNTVPLSPLPSLTIYMAGNWTSPATVKASYIGPGGTPITPITCTIASGSASYQPSTSPLCTGFFPVGTTVTLTTTDTTSPTFGGWSSNCVPVSGTPQNTYSCTITLSSSPTTTIGNYTVGAIFD